MNCWYCLGILLLLLLLCWVGSCPFGTVLVDLHVGFPLGVFRLVVMFGGPIAEFAGVEEVPRSSPVARAQLPGLVGGARVLGGRRIHGGVKRVRLHRKTPAQLSGFGGDGLSQSRARVWKRLRVEGSRCRHNVAKVPRLHQGDEAHGPLDRVGVG